MAKSVTTHDHVTYPDLAGEAGSDYGSDFTAEEESLVNDLLATLPTQTFEEEDLVVKEIEDDDRPRGARVARILGHEKWSNAGSRAPPQVPDPSQARVALQIKGHSAVSNLQSDESREQQRSASVDPALEAEVPDTRSPLLRFRTAPKKALSVTDLVSPSWCELQYWYTLTKHGRKRRTPAMRQGSEIHKTLEDEVHTTVAVDIITKEDAWGLRIWNTIQGLRTLQETGRTRELEIWGLIDGQVVNGVVDELSIVCPDPALQLEADTMANKASARAMPTDQTVLEDFLKSAGGRTIADSARQTRQSRASSSKKVYITDVKTRGNKTLPRGASFRPTVLQLMLYRHLLYHLATNKVDCLALFDRYQLDPSANFTDSFIAQIGNLNTDAFSSPTTSPLSSQDSLQLLTSHNSLLELWSLMIQTFLHTFPAGAASIGDVLQAEYRSPADGEVIGAKTLLYDSAMLQTYLADEIRWWRGEREAVGVSVEEAYKCRSCEFADGCDWRIAKIEEATVNHRLRSRSVV